MSSHSQFKRFNILQELEQAIKKKTHEKYKSKSKSKQIEIVKPLRTPHGDHKPAPHGNSQSRKNTQTIKSKCVEFKVKKHQNKKFDKMVSLVNYAITSADKALKYVNLSSNFEAEFAYKLYLSDRENLMMELNNLNLHEIVASFSGQNQPNYQNSVEMKALQTNSQFSNIEIHALKNENDKMKKEIMILEGELRKSKNRLENNPNQDSRSSVPSPMISKNQNREKEDILKRQIEVKEKQSNKLSELLKRLCNFNEIYDYLDCVEKEMKYRSVLSSSGLKGFDLSRGQRQELEQNLTTLDSKIGRLESVMMGKMEKLISASENQEDEQILEELQNINKLLHRKIAPILKQSPDYESLQNKKISEIITMYINHSTKKQRELSLANEKLEGKLIDFIQMSKDLEKKENHHDGRVKQLEKQNELVKSNLTDIYEELKAVLGVDENDEEFDGEEITFETLLKRIDQTQNALIENTQQLKGYNDLKHDYKLKVRKLEQIEGEFDKLADDMKKLQHHLHVSKTSEKDAWEAKKQVEEYVLILQKNKKQKEAEFEDIAEQISQLQGSISQYQSQNQHLESQLQRNEQQSALLQREFEKMNQLMVEKDHELNDTHEKINELQGRLQTLEAENQINREEIISERDNAQRSIQDKNQILEHMRFLEEKVKEAEAEIELLGEKLHEKDREATSTLSEVRQNMTQLEQEKKHFEVMYTNLSQSMESEDKRRSEEVATLNQKIMLMSSENQKLVAQNEDLSEKIDNLIKQTEVSKQQTSLQFDEERQQLQTEIFNLREQTAALKAQRQQESQNLQLEGKNSLQNYEVSSPREQVEKQAQQKQQQYNLMAQELSESKIQIIRLEKTIDENNDKLKQFEAKIEELQNSNQSKDNELEDQYSELNELKSLLANIQSASENLKNEVIEKQKEVSTQRQKIDQLQMQIQSKSQEPEIDGSLVGQRQQQISKLEEQIESLKQNMASNGEELEEVKNQLSMKSAQLTENQQKIGKFEALLLQKDSQIQVLYKSNQEKEGKIQELERQAEEQSPKQSELLSRSIEQKNEFQEMSMKYNEKVQENTQLQRTIIVLQNQFLEDKKKLQMELQEAHQKEVQELKQKVITLEEQKVEKEDEAFDPNSSKSFDVEKIQHSGISQDEKDPLTMELQSSVKEDQHRTSPIVSLKPVMKGTSEHRDMIQYEGTDSRNVVSHFTEEYTETVTEERVQITHIQTEETIVEKVSKLVGEEENQRCEDTNEHNLSLQESHSDNNNRPSNHQPIADSEINYQESNIQAIESRYKKLVADLKQQISQEETRSQRLKEQLELVSSRESEIRLHAQEQQSINLHLSEEIEQLRDVLKLRMGENDKLRDQAEEMAHEIDETKKKFIRELDSYEERELMPLKGQLQEKQELLRKQQEKYTELEQLLKQTQQSNEQHITALQRQHELKSEADGAKFTEYEKRVQSVRGQMDELKLREMQAIQDKETISTELWELKNVQESNQQIIGQLKEELEQARRSKVQESQSKAEKREKIRLERMVSDLEVELEILKETNILLQMQQQCARAQFADQQQELRVSHQKQLSEHSQKVASEQVPKKISETEEFILQVDSLNDEIQLLRHNNRLLVQEDSNKFDKIRELEGHVREMERVQIENRIEADDLKGQFDRVSEQKQVLQQELLLQRHNKQLLIEQGERKTQKINALQQELQALYHVSVPVQSQDEKLAIQKLEKETSELRNQISEITEQLEIQKYNKDLLIEQGEAKSKKIDELQTELKKNVQLVHTISQNSAQTANWKRKMDALQEEIALISNSNKLLIEEGQYKSSKIQQLQAEMRLVQVNETVSKEENQKISELQEELTLIKHNNRLLIEEGELKSEKISELQAELQELQMIPRATQHGIEDRNTSANQNIQTLHQEIEVLKEEILLIKNSNNLLIEEGQEKSELIKQLRQQTQNMIEEHNSHRRGVSSSEAQNFEQLKREIQILKEEIDLKGHNNKLLIEEGEYKTEKINDLEIRVQELIFEKRQLEDQERLMRESITKIDSQNVIHAASKREDMKIESNQRLINPIEVGDKSSESKSLSEEGDRLNDRIIDTVQNKEKEAQNLEDIGDFASMQDDNSVANSSMVSDAQNEKQLMGEEQPAVIETKYEELNEEQTGNVGGNSDSLSEQREDLGEFDDIQSEKMSDSMVSNEASDALERGREDFGQLKIESDNLSPQKDTETEAAEHKETVQVEQINYYSKTTEHTYTEAISYSAHTSEYLTSLEQKIVQSIAENPIEEIGNIQIPSETPRSQIENNSAQRQEAQSIENYHSVPTHHEQIEVTNEAVQTRQSPTHRQKKQNNSDQGNGVTETVKITQEDIGVQKDQDQEEGGEEQKAQEYQSSEHQPEHKEEELVRDIYADQPQAQVQNNYAQIKQQVDGYLTQICQTVQDNLLSKQENSAEKGEQLQKVPQQAIESQQAIQVSPSKSSEREIKKQVGGYLSEIQQRVSLAVSQNSPKQSPQKKITSTENVQLASEVLKDDAEKVSEEGDGNEMDAFNDIQSEKMSSSMISEGNDHHDFGQEKTQENINIEEKSLQEQEQQNRGGKIDRKDSPQQQNDLEDFNDMQSEKMSSSMISEENNEDQQDEKFGSGHPIDSPKEQVQAAERQQQKQSAQINDEQSKAKINHEENESEGNDIDAFNDMQSEKMSNSMISQAEQPALNEPLLTQQESKAAQAIQKEEEPERPQSQNDSGNDLDAFNDMASEKMSSSMISQEDKPDQNDLSQGQIAVQKVEQPDEKISIKRDESSESATNEAKEDKDQQKAHSQKQVSGNDLDEFDDMRSQKMSNSMISQEGQAEPQSQCSPHKNQDKKQQPTDEHIQREVNNSEKSADQQNDLDAFDDMQSEKMSNSMISQEDIKEKDEMIGHSQRGQIAAEQKPQSNQQVKPEENSSELNQLDAFNDMASEKMSSSMISQQDLGSHLENRFDKKFDSEKNQKEEEKSMVKQEQEQESQQKEGGNDFDAFDEMKSEKMSQSMVSNDPLKDEENSKPIKAQEQSGNDFDAFDEMKSEKMSSSMVSEGAFNEPIKESSQADQQGLSDFKDFQSQNDISDSKNSQIQSTTNNNNIPVQKEVNPLPLRQDSEKILPEDILDSERKFTPTQSNNNENDDEEDEDNALMKFLPSSKRQEHNKYQQIQEKENDDQNPFGSDIDLGQNRVSPGRKSSKNDHSDRDASASFDSQNHSDTFDFKVRKSVESIDSKVDNIFQGFNPHGSNSKISDPSQNDFNSFNESEIKSTEMIKSNEKIQNVDVSSNEHKKKTDPFDVFNEISEKDNESESMSVSESINNDKNQGKQEEESPKKADEDFFDF